mmetsp:Transcript_24975/g.41145  ORF Transcript_24975/g.41145 Transcript_24975/m.41145 type:complete len:179 (-) Transcript_24975:494-1030(-)
MLRRAASAVLVTIRRTTQQSAQVRTGGTVAAQVSSSVPSTAPSAQEKIVSIIFQGPTGRRVAIKGYAGQTLLQAAVNRSIDLEGAYSCRGRGLDTELYGEGPECFSCHVVLSREFYSKVSPPTEAEIDRLDMAGPERAATSRLACQIVLTPALDGLVVSLPKSSPALQEHPEKRDTFW